MGKSVFMTGVAIANSMIGSSMIILPLNFNKYGVVANSVFVVHFHRDRSSCPASWP